MKIVAVKPIQGEARADSRDIAKALGNHHKSVMSLFAEYLPHFQALGQLPFETEVGKRAQGGGNPAKYAYLNEDQCYFLLTLVRNSEKVVELKLQLVQAFSDLRRLNAPALDLAPLQQIVNLTAAAINASEQKVMAELDARIEQFAAQQPISPAQGYEIQQLVGELARRMGGKPFHYAQAWRLLKDKFKVPRYQALEARQFQDATRFVTELIATYKGRPALLGADA